MEEVSVGKVCSQPLMMTDIMPGSFPVEWTYSIRQDVDIEYNLDILKRAIDGFTITIALPRQPLPARAERYFRRN